MSDTANKQVGGRKHSEGTSSVSSAREATNRLSFGGSIRLNDLLNDDDDYGFAEEATEASLREYETDEHPHSTAISDPLVLSEEPQKVDHAVASSCPSSISSALLPTEKKRNKTVSGYRSIAESEDFDDRFLYSSREGHDELTGTGFTPSSSSSTATAYPSGAVKECDRGDRISLGEASVGSHDSREGGNKSYSDGSCTGQITKEKHKGIGAFIDKAKHRLGASKEREKKSCSKELSQSEADNTKEANFEMTATAHEQHRRPSSLPIELSAVREDKLWPMLHLITHHLTHLPFPQTRLYIGAILVAMTMAWPGFLIGVIWGMYISGMAFLFFFVSDPRERGDDEEKDGRAQDTQSRTNVFEDIPISSLRLNSAHDGNGSAHIVVYRGWMNEFPPTARYDPSNYHVNSCRCVLVRLEGTTLRISRPSRAVLKHAFHMDPTLTATPPSMVGQSIYDLTDATVSLRPRRLARLRWWSRKYPIYIRFKKEQDEEGGTKNRKRNKRSVLPRMKRSISMHPSTSGIAEAAAIGVERVRIEGDERRVDSQDDWTTTESEWEDDVRLPSAVATGFARTRSSTEISVVGTVNAIGNYSSTSSLRRAEIMKPRGIYLFARAAREKERWFHLLREACAKARITRSRVQSDGSTVIRSRSTTTMSEGLETTTPLTPSEKTKRGENTVAGSDNDICHTATAAREFMLYKANQAHFAKSMSEAMGLSLAALAKMTVAASSTSATGGSVAAAAFTTTPAGTRANIMTRDGSLDDDTQSVNLGSIRWKPSNVQPSSSDLVASVNAIAGRIFFDFCRDEYWCNQVKEKIQTKLATIHLPYFIENLELSNLDLGTTTPHIESVHAPVCDEWGLWVDFEMKYSGGIRLALETRINLLKLQTASDEADNAEESQSSSRARRSNRPATRYSDEDLPESPEDSPDEDFGAKMSAEKEKEISGRERAASKIVSLVESAARSSIFQKAARLSKVAKVITDISSTRLILNVEIEAIEGIMTINLPPPPSDRIWYAFRKRPKVSIRAIPQVGDRSVDLTTVSDWIESKLRLLIEKNLVCPNMDDIIIPAMSGNELLKMNYNR